MNFRARPVEPAINLPIPYRKPGSSVKNSFRNASPQYHRHRINRRHRIVERRTNANTAAVALPLVREESTLAKFERRPPQVNSFNTS